MTRIQPESLLGAGCVLGGLLTLAWAREFLVVLEWGIGGTAESVTDALARLGVSTALPSNFVHGIISTLETLETGGFGALVLPAVLAIMAGTIVLGGWRRGDPRALQNAMERADRMALFTVVMGLAILTAVMVMGRGDFAAHGLEQAHGAFRWLGFHNPFSFLSMTLFFVSGAAGLSSPEDASSFDRRLWRGLMFLVCAVQVALWLGAWYDPLGLIAALENGARVHNVMVDGGLAIWATIAGIIVFVAKTLLLMAVQRSVGKMMIANRCCQAAIRLDILLPVAILNVLATASYLWLVEPLKDFRTAIRIVLTIVALVGAGWLTVLILLARTKIIASSEKS